MKSIFRKKIWIFMVLLIIALIIKNGSGMFSTFKNKFETISFFGKPRISAKAALTLDVSDNKIIYQKNIHEKMYPASTTKLLTAQVFADNMQRDSLITYTRDSKMQPASKLDLIVGEKLTGDTAMKGMLIYSANDIAEAIGENVSGSIPAFAEKMNEKARSLGLHESNFENSNGLPDENHYTTAYDLSLIAKNVYKYPWIMETIEKRNCDIRTRGRYINLQNTNKLLGVHGCIAGKTGYTSEAGRCLVAYYERDNKKMIGIVLCSPDEESVDKDMEKIINWSYSKLH